MKQEAFLIVGITTILTMAFFLGGRDKSCAKKLFTNTEKEYKFISTELKDTITTYNQIHILR
jgi:hypothetical protein